MTHTQHHRSFFGFAALVLLASSALGAELPVVFIGTLVDGPCVELTEFGPLYKDEILTLTEGEFDVRFEARHQVVADWTLAGVEAGGDRLLADPEVDLIVGLGVLASHTFCCRGSLEKPVIAPLVIDVDVQGFELVDGHSGVTNLNFMAMPDTVAQDLVTFKSIVPFRKLAMLSNAAFQEAIFARNDEVRERARQELGVGLVMIPVGDSVSAVLAQIPGDVDAVYLTALHHLSMDDRKRLLDGLIARRLPSFSWLGRGEVEQGAMVGLTTAAYYPRLARRMALNVQRILLGEAPESLPIHFSISQQLVINMATARAIRIFPSWDVMLEAELINEEDKTGRTLNLRQAVQEAVASNLDLVAQATGVTAGLQHERLARALLLPRLEASTLGVWIDRDRASSIFSTQPERTITGALSLTQVLWSEPLRANLDVQEHLQAARQASYNKLRLEIAQAAATAYLNVLRARTLERIQRDNLKLSRSNLVLARVRRSVGTAVEAEVVRWESRIASDRRALVDARALREQAAVALNRILHRPLEEPFQITDVDKQTPGLITSHAPLTDYTRDPLRQQLLRNFLAIESIEYSPELAELDRLVVVKERELKAARRAYYSPTVALQGDFDKRLASGGAGADPVALPELPFPLDLPDDTNWSLALNVSLPLFAGRQRPAEVERLSEELAELRLTRRSVAEKVEQRMRSALFAAKAASQGIDLSREAARAAQRNLELVTDAYARGAVSIIDLLDAQNAALLGELAAANANYDFLIVLMEVERSAGRLDLLETDTEREKWLERLKKYLLDAGIRLEDE